MRQQPAWTVSATLDEPDVVVKVVDAAGQAWPDIRPDPDYAPEDPYPVAGWLPRAEALRACSPGRSSLPCRRGPVQTNERGDVHILAIDQGTSGTKALVWSPERGVVGRAERPVRPAYLADGGVEVDPQDLLTSVLESGRSALAQARVSPDAVALANQGETVLAWDRTTGSPRSPAIGWQDRRAEGLCRELAAEGPRLAQATGLTLDPYFSAPKLAWLRRNGVSGGVVTTTDTWLVHQLTGAFVTDRSTASRSLLLPLEAQDWDLGLAAIFGLEDEELPRIVGSDEVVGTTTAFGGEVPVAGLVVDQQAALLAEGCTSPGLAKCTYGTGAFVLANTGTTAPRSTHGLSTSVAWQLREGTAYCLDGQVYTAASAVRWLQDLGLIQEPAQLDGRAADDSGGVLCVPAFAGLAAPWWRPEATASLAGLTLATTAGHLVTAVLEGIAAQVAEICGLMAGELGAPLARLRVDGGLTRSSRLMQAQADLAQLPLDVFSSPDATALGAAALARLALDPTLTPEQASAGWTPAASYEPVWSADRAADHLSRWRQLASEAAVRPR